MVPTLSVVVPATNSPATLASCLAALEASEDRPDELIVVERCEAPGPAHARNAGARDATGDVVVFVDADVVAHPDALARIRRAFADDAGLTAIFGSYDDAPDAPGVVSVFRNLLHHHVHHQAAGEASTFWAGLGAVRRDAFLAAGGFDAERFHVPSVEDVELGLRLSAEGARIRLDPSVRGTHLKAWSFHDMVRTDLLRRGVPWVRLLLRHGSSSALNLGWRHRLSALASLGAVAALLVRRPAAAALSTGALVALNRGFYALLLRRLGPRGAVAGVGLHVVHLLTAVASVPLALLFHAIERRRR